MLTWIVIICSKVVDVDQTAVCNYLEEQNIMTIYDFHSNYEFQQVHGRCIDARAQAVVYRSCSVTYVELDMRYITTYYKNAHHVLWTCKGICVYKPVEELNVQGECFPGNFCFPTL